MINTNPFFAQLSMVSKYQLVYEAMYQEQYFPGELVMSMDQRSALNKNYIEFYKDRHTQMHDDIDRRKKEE